MTKKLVWFGVAVMTTLLALVEYCGSSAPSS
jgi:hypothetical protein